MFHDCKVYSGTVDFLRGAKIIGAKISKIKLDKNSKYIQGRFCDSSFCTLLTAYSKMKKSQMIYNQNQQIEIEETEEYE